ncbi:4-cresol dehydrogenase [Pseudoclavibacter endophyticus]|uniref:FAD-binding oxidoreductase n=1 Tax=Pseudoclavibacter endophyticus TaxID=1778590 RepID=A0A6H9WRM9_9MICO|nr:FAD-binding oxidoreductase [Pseudoclavibacter endophyticus]KAB1648990.1 FAD-binding oxidoreductase [Pseudoclavibacter endophyticus]GGA66443.1 4-cresol dehydrogenase [Pseudoclavibacter endophyticus]
MSSRSDQDPLSLPDGVSPEAFGAMLAELRRALGADAVLTGDDAAEFGDPYDPYDRDHVPSAVVLPSTVEGVQTVVRSANAHGVPLWTTSQGRNNGYGGGAPVVGGSVTLSLRRLNRIRELNDELGYAVVEPGVRFFDLAEACRERGGAWWPSSPSLGWGSVVGNTIDHGFGYTPYGDHAAHVYGMEVVLPDGELLRTGMWASTRSTSAHAHPRGFGPNVAPLFMQSNFGVVTAMGRPLLPRPEVYAPVTIRVARHDDLEPLVDAMRVLTTEGSIDNIANITSALGAASMRKPRRDWYDGPGPIPEDIYRDMMREVGSGWWNCTAAMYGPRAVVEAKFARVEQVVVGAIPDARVSVKFVPGDEAGGDTLENHRERIMTGTPSLEMLDTTTWWGEDGGHLEVSPIAPATGADATTIAGILRPIVEGEGFDLWASIYVMKRSLMYLAVVMFDRADPARVEAAYRLARRAYPALADAGYTPYRGNVRYMDMMQDTYDFNDHAMRRFLGELKDAIDPGGILSPGKQGIWPQRFR